MTFLSVMTLLVALTRVASPPREAIAVDVAAQLSAEVEQAGCDRWRSMRRTSAQAESVPRRQRSARFHSVHARGWSGVAGLRHTVSRHVTHKLTNDIL